MTESQLQMLQNYPHQYVSIGITPGAQPRTSFWVPWERTGNAHNMRVPDIFLDPGDLQEAQVWAWLDSRKVNGCFIFCPLEDYSFLSRLPHLEGITILRGGALRDLHFLRDLPNWFQLHVEDAELEDLADLFPEGRKQQIIGYCVCLAGCTVRDHTALLRPDIRLSELVILAPEGSDDRERWKAVRCGKYSYYEYRVRES